MADGSKAVWILFGETAIFQIQYFSGGNRVFALFTSEVVNSIF
jgi:hypothetical protein